MHEIAVQADPDAVRERQLLEDRLAKQAARQVQLARAREQAQARRVEVERQVAASVLASPVQALPFLDLSELRARLAREAVEDGTSDSTRDGTEQAIFSCLLATRTDYDRLVRLLNRLEAGFELSAAVKVYVFCRVIGHYCLALDPLELAFPSAARGTLPAAFASGDPEQVAATIIGIR